MFKRELGKTGIQVSEIAFGCVEIGMPYGIGVNSVSDMLTETGAIKLLQTALQSGINFFDTARAYGNSENIIGQAFKNSRSEVVIATKCKNFLNPDGSVPAYNKLKQIIENSLEESLAALQTDCIDIYMLHQANIQILQNKDVQSIFTALKEAGCIKATGVSTYTNEETALAINTGIWDVIQLPFNLMDQRQSVLFNHAQANGIGLIIRSVLSKGLLTDKGKNLHPALNKVEQHIQKYEDLASQSGVNLATLATRFALSFPQVSAILIGIDKLSYLKESVAAAEGNYLNDSVLMEAKRLVYPEPEFLDLPHWDRQGWLK